MPLKRLPSRGKSLAFGPAPVPPPPTLPTPVSPGESLAAHEEAPDYVALVVDDDVRNVVALTALLERRGLTVIRAESGEEALAALKTANRIDIVFMDIMMPVMDGYEAIRAIRQTPKFAALPIVAVTAKTASGEEARCLAAGASSYVPKPIDTARLLLAVGEWLPR